MAASFFILSLFRGVMSLPDRIIPRYGIGVAGYVRERKTVLREDARDARKRQLQ
jgi:hypothetical protein